MGGFGVTVCGIHATCSSLTVWADDLVTYRNGHTGRRPKIALNSRAGVVLTGAGWLPLLVAAETALQDGADFDELLPRVVGAVRRAVPSVATRLPDSECLGFPDNILLIGGWCASWRRFVAYQLEAGTFFTPVLTSFATSPVVTWKLGETALATAARQAAAFPDPARQVGELTVATITADGLTVSPPQPIAPVPAPDLATPAFVAGPSCGAGPARFGNAACRPEHLHDVAA